MATPSNSEAGASEKGVEVRARSVDEAVARGLVRLGGLSRSEVRIEVINAGKSGLLGFGAEEAVVRIVPLAPGERAETVTREPAAPPPARPEPAPPEAAPPPPPAARPARPAEPPAPSAPQAGATGAAAPAPAPQPAPAPARAPGSPPAALGMAEALPVAREIVEGLLARMGYGGLTLEARGTLLPVAIEGEDTLVLDIRGPGVDRLLAADARALLALQFIARLMLNQRTEAWDNLLLDVNGDRSRRLKEIYHMAEQSAALVERDGRPVSLPPMSAYERRVVHLALREHDRIATQSIGSGSHRKVTVRRKDDLLPEL